MEIRELSEKDIGQLANLILKVYVDSPAAMTFKKKPTKKHLQNLIQNKLMAAEARESVDFVAVSGVNLISNCEIVRRGRDVGVIGIIVAKNYRGKGIGKRILEMCVSRAKRLGIRKVSAEISRENANVAWFFFKCGFEKISIDGKSGNILMLRKLV